MFLDSFGKKMKEKLHMSPQGFLHLRAKLDAVSSMRHDSPDVSSSRQEALDAFEQALVRGTVYSASFGTSNEHLKDWDGRPLDVIVHFEDDKDEDGQYAEPREVEKCTRLIISDYLTEAPEKQKESLSSLATCLHF